MSGKILKLLPQIENFVIEKYNKNPNEEIVVSSYEIISKFNISSTSSRDVLKTIASKHPDKFVYENACLKSKIALKNKEDAKKEVQNQEEKIQKRKKIIERELEILANYLKKEGSIRLDTAVSLLFRQPSYCEMLFTILKERGIGILVKNKKHGFVLFTPEKFLHVFVFREHYEDLKTFLEGKSKEEIITRANISIWEIEKAGSEDMAIILHLNEILRDIKLSLISQLGEYPEILRIPYFFDKLNNLFYAIVENLKRVGVSPQLIEENLNYKITIEDLFEDRPSIPHF